MLALKITILYQDLGICYGTVIQLIVSALENKMHLPQSFKIKETKTQHEIIKKYPLATIITSTETGVIANHIPLLLIERNNRFYLQGHAIANNDMSNNDVLAIFQGPNAYISPSWYPTKKETGKEVPTWNYLAVHVRGSLQFYSEGSWLLNHLTALSDTHESAFENPWKLSDAPSNYIQKMLSAIVGIEIEIKSMQGKIKMSQNHPEQNRQGVIDGLSQLGQLDVSQWVQNPLNS